MSYTDDQIIAALREHGSNRKAAAALGLNARTVDRRRSDPYAGAGCNIGGRCDD